MILCPFCGHSEKIDFIVCPGCGRDIIKEAKYGVHKRI